jgi:hypothetical protein
MNRNLNHPGRPKRHFDTPRRFRAARIDASVGTIVRKIEKEYDLPRGSVKIILPSGRMARSDKTVKSLIYDWN